MATDQPGGPGKFARRNDLGNVKKIQRSAKIQNASGGAYGQRAEMQGIAAGAPMAQAMPAVTAPTGNLTARGMRTTGAFDPTERPDEPITAGIDVGPGPGSSALMMAKSSEKLSDTLAKMLPFDTTGEIAILYQDALSRGN